MADTKLTDLTSATPAAADKFYFVKTSDTTDSAAGSSRVCLGSDLVTLVSSDLVSPLKSPEVAVTTTATATISKMHVCSGTSSNYTVSLPSVSGNTGRLIGFRMAPGLTKLVTLDAGAGVNINGASTTLSGTINSSVTSLTVASATGFPANGNFVIQIDSEQMLVTAGQGTTTWTVTRGVNGTTGASHTSGVAVDWQRTRVMWANESALLECDGTNWFKVAGISVPMQAQITRTSTQSPSASTITKVQLSTLVFDPATITDYTTNYRITLTRNGRYNVYGNFAISGVASSGNYVILMIYKNGTEISRCQQQAAGSGAVVSQNASIFMDCIAGDYFELYLWTDSASTSVSGSSTNQPRLSVAEMIQW